MAKATKLASGKYCCRVYDKYKKKQVCFTHEQKKEAERLANLYKYSLEKHTETMTFGEAFDLYCEAHPEWTGKTKKEHQRWKELKYKDLLPLKLDDITDEYLQVWLDTNFKGLSGKTVLNQFSPVRATLKRYRPHRAICVTMPKKIKPKLYLPSEADVVRLMGAVEDTEFCVPVYLAAFGCMRRGEIAALDLDHINFDTRQIHIEYSKAVDENREWYLKPPKNGHPRRIIVPTVLINKIKEKGLPVIDNPDVFSADFVDFLDDNELPRMRFHDLRHYCAARMLSATPNPIPISAVQQYGGWLNKSVLLDIYDYLIAEINDSSMANWDAQAEQISNKLVMKSENP